MDHAKLLDKSGKPKKEFDTTLQALWCFEDLCISPLHCSLRIFEALYRIGYLQDVKTGRVNKHTRPKVNERKKRIQEEFRKRGMKVGKYLHTLNMYNHLKKILNMLI